MASGIRRPVDHSTKRAGMIGDKDLGEGDEGRNTRVFVSEERKEERIAFATSPPASLQMQSAHLERGEERKGEREGG
jgi:hypothetical protein